MSFWDGDKEVVIKAVSYGNKPYAVRVGALAYDGDLILSPADKDAPTFYPNVKQAKRLRKALGRFIDGE